MVTEVTSKADMLRAVAAALHVVTAWLEQEATGLDAATDRAVEASFGDDRLLTVDEAATQLRCSSRFVRAACKRGDIKAWKNGGWKIRRSALAIFERRRTGLRRIA